MVLAPYPRSSHYSQHSRQVPLETQLHPPSPLSATTSRLYYGSSLGTTVRTLS